ncbi:MAG: hypothetical protein IT198_15400 [Acidimicrobiia bacterium]|nr:hypothetical protein [Acidimicrobiia bacterium]
MARQMRRSATRLVPQAMVAAVLADLDRHGPDRLWPVFRRIQAAVPWDVTDGNVQGAMTTCVKSGWLEVSEVEGAKVYAMTDTGREAVASWMNARTEEIPTQRDELVLRLALLGDELDGDVLLNLVADKEHRIRVRLARLRELTDDLDGSDPLEAARKDAFTWATDLLETELDWLRRLNAKLRGEGKGQEETTAHTKTRNSA